MKSHHLILVFVAIIIGYGCKKEKTSPLGDQGMGSSLNSNFSSSDPMAWTSESLFNGTLDFSNIWMNGYPWGNTPFEANVCDNNRTCILPANVFVYNDQIKIKTDTGPFSALANDGNYYNYDWSRGLLFSMNTYKFGYFEITAKAPAGYGLGANFWLYGGNPADEIDIFEMKGWSPNKFPTNYHRNDYAVEYPEEISTSYDFTNSYNTFGLEWTSNKLVWYINDIPVRTEFTNIPDQFMNIILDVNCPRNETCPNLSTVFPNYFSISDVTYYNHRPVNSSFLSTSNSGSILTPIKEYTKWRKTWTHVIPGDFDDDDLTDLFLYDKKNGKARFYNSSGGGQSLNGLSSTWSHIVAGNFDGSGNTDLLFYDNSNGQVEIHSVSSNGGLGTIVNYNGWSLTWDKIIPGDFDDDNLTDVLLYDKMSGEAHFFNSSGMGQSFTGWRKTWSQMIPGNFDGTGNTDLMFYDSNGDVIFYKVYSNAGLGTLNSLTHWRKTWEIMAPGNFDNDNLTDILLYDKINGHTEIYNSSGIGTSLNNWRKSWDKIVTGNFDGTGKSDLFLYDNY